MGLTLSWIAIKGGNKEELFERLGLEEIGEASDWIGPGFALAETSQGWLVLVQDWPSDMDQVLATAAPEGCSLGGRMVEGVTFSELRGYSDGRLSWSVAHDPDQGRAPVVQGNPPEPFDDIRRRLEAQQADAGDQPVAYLFDLPLELAESLSGYYPGQGGLHWAVLGRKKPARVKDAAPRRQSLTTTMKAEVLPLLWSLGWTSANDKPDLGEPDQIVREVGSKKQTLWFDYESGRETYIGVSFRSEEPAASGSVKVIEGRGGYASRRLPWWRRFSWSRFWAITRAPPPQENAIAAAIEQAKADIFAIDDYLKSGTENPRVQVRVSERPKT